MMLDIASSDIFISPLVASGCQTSSFRRNQCVVLLSHRTFRLPITRYDSFARVLQVKRDVLLIRVLVDTAHRHVVRVSVCCPSSQSELPKCHSRCTYTMHCQSRNNSIIKILTERIFRTMTRRTPRPIELSIYLRLRFL